MKNDVKVRRPNNVSSHIDARRHRPDNRAVTTYNLTGNVFAVCMCVCIWWLNGFPTLVWLSMIAVGYAPCASCIPEIRFSPPIINGILLSLFDFLLKHSLKSLKANYLI